MITDHYSLVEVVLGTSLFLWGLSTFLNKKLIKNVANVFLSTEENYETMGYLLAIMLVICGTVIVYTHNDWYVGLSLLTTLMGWILVIKCFLWLSFKKQMRNKFKKFKPYIAKSWFHKVYGATAMILGLAILWNHSYLVI